MKLDKKDFQILYELDKNSRQSNSQISKKLKTSPEVVNYRIKRLENNGIISRYITIPQLYALDIFQFKICLCLQNISPEKLLEKIEKLKKKDSVKWIVETKGVWDLVISLEAESLEQVDMIEDIVCSLFAMHIRKKSIAILNYADAYTRDYLVEKIDRNRKRAIYCKTEKPELTKKELDIFKELAKNSRIPIVDLAEKLGTTPRVIQYTIKKLEKSIITGYRIIPDYEKANIKFTKLFIYLTKKDKESFKKIQVFLASSKYTNHYAKVLSDWDIEIELEAFNQEDIEKVVSEMKSRFSEEINHLETIDIKKEHKFVYY
mgnify:CR=1 FL=1